MTDDTITIERFLRERVTEVEGHVYSDIQGHPGPASWQSVLVLELATTIRTAVAEHHPIDGGCSCGLPAYPCPTLKALSRPWADHEDHRESWL